MRLTTVGGFSLPQMGGFCCLGRLQAARGLLACFSFGTGWCAPPGGCVGCSPSSQASYMCWLEDATVSCVNLQGFSPNLWLPCWQLLTSCAAP